MTNRLEGQFLRTEGDKRLNNDAAAREARDARSRCEELSRILDHQTRITDALSHEMASIRGRVEIKDLRQDRKDRNVFCAIGLLKPSFRLIFSAVLA